MNPRQGKPWEIDTSTFREAYVTVSAPCPVCKGTGSVKFGKSNVQCGKCNGTGQVGVTDGKGGTVR